jgi:uncharacterized protein YndB with AHSA1/START domain
VNGAGPGRAGEIEVADPSIANDLRRGLRRSSKAGFPRRLPRIIAAIEPVTVATSIDAPRERVFDVLVDLANRPSFTDHFVAELRLERHTSAGVGAAARFRVEPPGGRIWIETVIEEAERPHRILERGRGGRIDRIPVFTAWEILGGPGTTSEARVAFWTEPSHSLDRLRELLGARRWYRRQWSRALRRLKELVESGRAVEPVRIGGEDRIPTLPARVR